MNFYLKCRKTASQNPVADKRQDTATGNSLNRKIRRLHIIYNIDLHFLEEADNA